MQNQHVNPLSRGTMGGGGLTKFPYNTQNGQTHCNSFYFEFTVMEKLYAGLSVNSWKMVCYAILIFIVTFKYLVPLAHQYIKSVVEKEEHAS